MGVLNLPDGYSEIRKVDLQKDKKLAVLINASAFIVMIALYIVGSAFVPLSLSIESGNALPFILKAFGVFLSVILYLFAHELIHGVFIRKYSGKKAKYGFTGLYAYASSEAYFNKRQYVIIALSPIFLFGTAFFSLNILLSAEWFWGIYLLQIVNLSGAAGDIYVAILMSRLPSDILVKDEGVAMTIYSRGTRG